MPTSSGGPAEADDFLTRQTELLSAARIKVPRVTVNVKAEIKMLEQQLATLRAQDEKNKNEKDKDDEGKDDKDKDDDAHNDENEEQGDDAENQEDEDGEDEEGEENINFIQVKEILRSLYDELNFKLHDQQAQIKGIMSNSKNVIEQLQTKGKLMEDILTEQTTKLKYS